MYLQYLFCIHFCPFYLPTALHVFLDNFVYRKHRHLYTQLPSSLLFSVKTSCNLTFFRALAFFLSEVTNSVVQSGCFFVSTNLFLRSTLSCTYQGSLSIHSHLLISSFQVPILCFFSLEPSLLIILLAFFRDRFVYQRFMSRRPRRFSCIFPICLRSFSFSFAIGFATGLPFPW